MKNTPNKKPLINVQNVYKSFDGKPVIEGVSFDVHEHEVHAIIGTSGCGKSTLLRMICGLESVDSGTVELTEANYSMVFQYSALFDSLSVFENVAFSLRERPDICPEGYDTQFTEYSEKEIEEIVMERLRLVGLEDVAKKFPNELSGGMKKRVSFARAIVSNPRIILYDEPTAGLDPIASTVIEDYILKLTDELKASSIVVTHQLSTINRTSDQIGLLHDGVFQWTGTPDELQSTDNPYAQQFAHASLTGPMTMKH